MRFPSRDATINHYTEAKRGIYRIDLDSRYYFSLDALESVRLQSRYSPSASYCTAEETMAQEISAQPRSIRLGDISAENMEGL